MDVVLSSGFLAFGAHAGFLAALEDEDVPVDALCGTSSGALLGALWASGRSAREALAEVGRRAPLAWTRPAPAFWRGALSLGPMVAELRRQLPARFEDLSRPFGVGVVTAAGHALVTAGPLPEAVAASCAIPWVFAPIALPSGLAWDGGAADRTGLAAWRRHRPESAIALHLVERSHGAAGEDELSGITVVGSPRSGAALWSLGDVDAAFAHTRALTRARLAGPRPTAG